MSEIAGGARLAVLGSPIAHSRSPQLHLAAYRVLGLDWSYERIEVREDELADVLAGGWRGLSLTMPLKHRAYALSDSVDRLARLTGAVNTIAFTGEGVLGFNTDVAGLVTAIAEAGVERPSTVVILGGGATAASAVVAAGELGAEHVHVALRTPAKAAALEPLAAEVGLRMTAGPLSELGALDADLVISTLPSGTDPAGIPVAGIAGRAPLFDVAYEPWPSSLAAEWTDAGGRAISGIGMLLHQAVAQVRVFVTGDPLVRLDDEEAVVAAMRAVVA